MSLSKILKNLNHWTVGVVLIGILFFSSPSMKFLGVAFIFLGIGCFTAYKSRSRWWSIPFFLIIPVAVFYWWSHNPSLTMYRVRAVYNASIAAIEKDDTPAVNELINSGSLEINLKMVNGRTALMEAAHHKSFKVAKLLIDKGADVNILDDDRVTALMEAAGTNALDIAKLLLDKGAVDDITDQRGWSAVDYARTKGHTEMIELLKRAGGKNRRDLHGKNALGRQ